MTQDKINYKDYYYKYKALKYKLKNLDIENLENGQMEGGGILKRLKNNTTKTTNTPSIEGGNRTEEHLSDS